MLDALLLLVMFVSSLWLNYGKMMFGFFSFLSNQIESTEYHTDSSVADDIFGVKSLI